MNNAQQDREVFNKKVGRNINKALNEKYGQPVKNSLFKETYSNEWLADTIGLESPRVLYCYYNGTKAPSLQRIKAIADALDVSVDSLLD